MSQRKRHSNRRRSHDGVRRIHTPNNRSGYAPPPAPAVPVPTGILYQDAETKQVGQLWQMPDGQGFVPVPLVSFEETLKRIGMEAVRVPEAENGDD